MLAEEAAVKLLTVGEAPRDDRFDPAELAAYALTAECDFETG